MANVKDMTGKTFGRLKVMEKVPHEPCERIYWKCECSCGVTKDVSGTSLRSGHTKSCGCLSADKVVARNTTHGMAKTPLNNVYHAMKARCLNKNVKAYKNYGGRGITVCDRWLESFSNFYADMGDRPTGKHTLERIDNSKGYSKDNCEWRTSVAQCNNKRNNVLLTLGNITDTIANWSRITGINYGTLRSRVRTSGWSHERAICTEVAR